MTWYQTLALKDLNGNAIAEEVLADKAVIFVNVASFCGYTKQYGGLVELQKEADAAGFTVIGVPCNQFGAQEPGTSDQIAAFCETTFGVNFPLLEKQDVNGPARSALYKHLVGDGADVKWNFEKFVVAADGRVITRFGSGTRPEDPAIRQALAKALG